MRYDASKGLRRTPSASKSRSICRHTEEHKDAATTAGLHLTVASMTMSATAFLAVPYVVSSIIMSTKPRSRCNLCTIVASVLLALAFAAAYNFHLFFSCRQPPLIKALTIPNPKQFDTDGYICALHHRIQPSIMSSYVRTFYEFVGAENPRPHLASATAEANLLPALTKYARKGMHSSSDSSDSGSRLGIGADVGHDAGPGQQRIQS
ncbi:hypothetical protein K456DRAFT_454650 [Colletotrichum gloeosporioides 23]|nr:hypothetical protein K456DRAFT_454650 [Colletotrichum gloeosporioides 23]